MATGAIRWICHHNAETCSARTLLDCTVEQFAAAWLVLTSAADALNIGSCPFHQHLPQAVVLLSQVGNLRQGAGQPGDKGSLLI